jgi:ABC-type branched-subunit amino acid transport system ATPase component
MARARPDRTSAPHQLTLDDWAEMLNANHEEAGEPAAEPGVVAVLAEALAPRLAEELSQRFLPTAGAALATTARLLTLDELVAELPPAKRPETWKRWLYERTRRGEIPGCVKLGGMLFFEREPALAWLRAGATATG